MSKDKESESLEEFLRELSRGNFTHVNSGSSDELYIWTNEVINKYISHQQKKLDAANKLLLFNVKELDFQSQEAVRFKSELGAANEIIEKLKYGINSELKRCGGTVPILKQTLKEVKEMEDVN